MSFTRKVYHCRKSQALWLLKKWSPSSPAVVLPAAATSVSKKKIARDETLDSDSDEVENFEESDTDIVPMSEDSSSIIDDDNDLLPTDILRSNWEL